MLHWLADWLNLTIFLFCSERSGTRRESNCNLHSISRHSYDELQLESCKDESMEKHLTQRRMVFSVLEAIAYITAFVVVATLCAISVWLTITDISL